MKMFNNKLNDNKIKTKPKSLLILLLCAQWFLIQLNPCFMYLNKKIFKIYINMCILNIIRDVINVYDVINTESHTLSYKYRTSV